MNEDHPTIKVFRMIQYVIAKRHNELKDPAEKAESMHNGPILHQEIEEMIQEAMRSGHIPISFELVEPLNQGLLGNEQVL
jgi:hypothetical protein